MYKPTNILAFVLTIVVIFTACAIPSATNSYADVESPSLVVETAVMALSSTTNYCIEKPTIEVNEPYSDEEVTAIATTLAGECYDDKLEDKRSVSEVICNRVSDGNFGENVTAVVSAQGQFAGYWKQSRPISKSDIQIAKETLREWYDNNCEKMSEYLFFCSGPNRENTFRTHY